MRTRTCTNLIADVRSESGLGDGQFRTDVQITRYLNESIYALAQILADQSGMNYFQAKQGTTLYGGTSSPVSLPASCLQIERITWLDGTHEHPIRQASIDEEVYADTQSAVWDDSEVSFSYSYTANTVRFYPPPSTTKTVNIYYKSTSVGCYNASNVEIAELSTGTDYYDCRFGYEPWVVYDAAIKVRRAQDESVNELMAARNDVESRIRQLISSRATQSPKRLPSSKYRYMDY